jgi:chromosome segregation ATPase
MQQHRSITLLRDEVAQLQQMLRLRDQVCELSHIVGDLQGRFQDLFENQVDAQNALAQLDRKMASLQETVQEQQGRLHQLQELVHVHSMQLQSLGLRCARIGGF